MPRHKQPSTILWIEGAAFGFLLVLGWITEFTDAPHHIFAVPPSFSWGRLALKTAIVVAVWAGVHLATRRLLKRLHYLEEFLLVCSWCRKIGHDGAWKTTEDYFGTAFATETSHGVCPECSRNLFATFSQGTSERPALPTARRVTEA